MGDKFLLDLSAKISVLIYNFACEITINMPTRGVKFLDK